jgi:hypothetical protein
MPFPYTALMLCVGVLTTRWPGPGPSLVFPSRGPISGSYHEQRRKAEEGKTDHEAAESVMLQKSLSGLTVSSPIISPKTGMVATGMSILSSAYT